MAQPLSNHTPATVPLPDIFITDELTRRPRRVPDYQAENRCLVELARTLAQTPESLLQRVTEVAMELCHAETCGISLLEQSDGQVVFRWRGLSGTFAAHLGGMIQPNFTPCGIVVDRRQAQLVSLPERYYPVFKGMQPLIVESLSLPLLVAGEAKGTLWIVAHDAQRKFDGEDLRILSNLAEFTAAAYQVHTSLTAVVRQQAELERSNRELEQFVALVSHDLREPLRTVTSYTQLLATRYQGRLDPEAEELMRFTVAGAERMRERIDALLALARIGKAERVVRPTSLTTVLEEVMADLHAQLEATGATVQYDSLPTVYGNPEQLRSLFQNLLTNAVKFRHPDRAPSVRVRATPLPGYVEVSVVDNGIGIAAEHHGRIFAAFQRLHTEREYEGTGIGLAVCKKIVEQHGGSIRVESAPGQGTAFVFTLLR
jgi:signal transduction histidine kinase